jgi:hypothetical protein
VSAKLRHPFCFSLRLLYFSCSFIMYSFLYYFFQKTKSAHTHRSFNLY